MFQAKVVDKIKTYILLSVSFSSKIVPFMRDKVGKYGTAGQATEDNMAYAHCMLST